MLLNKVVFGDICIWYLIQINLGYEKLSYTKPYSGSELVESGLIH